jgi:hypothetical protein
MQKLSMKFSKQQGVCISMPGGNQTCVFQRGGEAS